MADDLRLDIEHLTVRFGGAIAVDDLTLAAATGHITSLIGPNGAGKTTTFNACTGLLRPTAGVIRLGGEDITRRPPRRRAQLGLGRTFQRMQLCESLTVRRNVALGIEARLAGDNPWHHIRSPRSEGAVVNRATDDALQMCSLGPVADRPVSSLSTGGRRLVELARVVATGSRLLLLDEPSSGLDGSETEEFGRILRNLVRAREVGILLVEHDMTLVMSVSEHIYVLDFGRLIGQGPPRQVQDDPAVRAAYLGDAA